MGTKKNSDPDRDIVVSIPESLLMKVVAKAHSEGKATHDFVNPVVVKALRGTI